MIVDPLRLQDAKSIKYINSDSPTSVEIKDDEDNVLGSLTVPSNFPLYVYYPGIEDLNVNIEPISSEIPDPEPEPDADALNYIERVEAADGEPLEDEIKEEIMAFFKNIKEDGLWEAITDGAAYILHLARTIEGAAQPLNSNAPSPTISGLTTEINYIRGVGASSFVNNHNINTNIKSGDIPKDNCHMSAYCSFPTLTYNESWTGAVISGDRIRINYSDLVNSSSVIRSGMDLNNPNVAGGDDITVDTFMGGFSSVSRNNSNSITFISHGSSAPTTITSPSSDYASPNTTIKLLTNRDSNSNAFNKGRVKFASVGSFLDIEKLKSHVDTLINNLSYLFPLQEEFELEISENTSNFNLLLESVRKGYIGGPSNINLLINEGVEVVSSSINSPSMKVGNFYNVGEINIINNGIISGRSGRGGSGGGFSGNAPTYGPVIPENGGPALDSNNTSINITNNGIIRGGGGGGAGGGSASVQTDDGWWRAPGGPGGHGAGLNSTTALSSGYLAGGINTANAQLGTPGTPTEGGNGGKGAYCIDDSDPENPIYAIGGNGGNGGGWGEPGQAGEEAQSTGSVSGVRAPGQAGYFAIGNSSINWIVKGIRLGSSDSPDME